MPLSTLLQCSSARSQEAAIDLASFWCEFSERLPNYWGHVAMSRIKLNADVSIAVPTDPPVKPPSLCRRPDPPPLRLVHILLFVAVYSAFLAFVGLPHMRHVLGAYMGPIGFEARVRIEAVARGVCLSALMTVAVLTLVWWLRGFLVGNLPGHWLALWSVWCMISTFCVVELIEFGRWLFVVRSADDYIRMWDWAKSLYLLQDAPFALLFLTFAVGWRKVASTWPWRAYFAFVGVHLAFAALHHLPYHWGEWVGANLAAWPPMIIDPFPGATQIVLALALLVDLMPGHPKRHWSHWTAAAQPVLLASIDLALWYRVSPQDMPIWYR
jgi:hypothetical protein